MIGATALVASACLDLPSLNRPDIPDGIPPGPGAPTPYIDINAPGRTAEL
ncbi:murein transglycosylase, partial [Streptomyces sp. SID10244]|nr:murein transglycosylase [Streptomyces sp. SID10244]